MLLETRGISKRFGSMYALKDVSLEITAGEFHALVGENGAGKSTFIKIISGVYEAEGGEIFWEGKKTAVTNPRQSRELGITVIHQDRHLVPSFTVVENVFLGTEYEKRGIMVDWKKMRRRVMSLMDELDIHIPPDVPAARLSPPQRTQTEILRAMMSDSRLLVLDEPTAALTDQEAAQLFSLIKKLQTRGAAILYVSHRLEEIIALSDRITVLRNGALVKTLSGKSTKEELISLITGDSMGDSASAPGRTGGVRGACLLDARGISSRDGTVKDVSLKAHGGEILGVFGLGGSGRTETLECVYGSREMAGGKVTLGGEDYPRPNPALSIKKGMAIISEDRRGKALVTNLSVKENTVLSVLDSYSRFGVMDDRAQEKDVGEKIDSLSIKTQGVDQPVAELSGGNQQKVVFAKALMPRPKVILCDEPTQAVDVKTRRDIHTLMRAMAEEGKAIVFVSSDAQELLEVSDRIQIISRGESRECFDNIDLSAEQLLQCCYAE